MHINKLYAHIFVHYGIYIHMYVYVRVIKLLARTLLHCAKQSTTQANTFILKLTVSDPCFCCYFFFAAKNKNHVFATRFDLALSLSLRSPTHIYVGTYIYTQAECQKNAIICMCAFVCVMFALVYVRQNHINKMLFLYLNCK